MAKKIIITILILLIIASLGAIGYIIISQNPNIKLPNLIPGRTTSQTNPLVPNNFFPEATTTTNSQPVSTTTRQEDSNNQSQGIITEGPNETSLLTINAVGLTLNNRGGKEQVLLIERSTGNVYEITNNNELFRLTNETILGIGEAYWGADKTANRLIIRTVMNDSVNNLVASVKYATSSTDLGRLTTQTLSPNIFKIAISPDKTKFFTLEKTGTGVTGYINSWDGKNKTKIWTFPLAEWQISWPKENIISLTTSASANEPGYLYFLNPTTGSFTKILSGVNGLTTNLSPDGQKILFSRSNLGRFQLFIYDLASNKTMNIGVDTLPEKCSWESSEILYCSVPRTISQGNYPDDWYQGKITFTDDVWKINVSQKTASLVQSLTGNYDLIGLTAANQRGWLYAINKTDGLIQAFSLSSE